MSSAVRLLLFALADYMGASDGTAHPSVETLARDTGYSVRHVKRLIRQAERTEWLAVKRRPHRTSLYIARSRGDLKQPEGDNRDTPGVTPESPKEPVNTQGITNRAELGPDLTHLVDGQRVLEDLRHALDCGSVRLHEVAALEGLGIADAEWVLEACEEVNSELAFFSSSDCFDFAAIALADMSRKSYRFTRKRFAGFLASTARFNDEEAALAIERRWNGRDFSSGQGPPQHRGDYGWLP